MPFIFALIAFVSALTRTIISARERKGKETMANLERRITELRKQERIEFAREAKDLERERTTIENRLKGYPNFLAVFNVIGVITSGLTVLSLIYQYIMSPEFRTGS